MANPAVHDLDIHSLTCCTSKSMTVLASHKPRMKPAETPTLISRVSPDEHVNRLPSYHHINATPVTPISMLQSFVRVCIPLICGYGLSQSTLRWGYRGVADRIQYSRFVLLGMDSDKHWNASKTHIGSSMSIQE